MRITTDSGIVFEREEVTNIMHYAKILIHDDSSCSTVYEISEEELTRIAKAIGMR